MPKGNHSQSNFLNVKTLSDVRSNMLKDTSILTSGLSNVIELEISDGTPTFDVPPIEFVNQHALQSADYRRIRDRLHTTATLKHEQSGKMRIRTIREDGATISVLAFKDHETSANLTDSIRIRSVLKDNEYQLSFSDWVHYNYLGDDTAQAVNQFRIQGVSKDLLHSQWVYSNMRNQDNEEILFKLLHDFLDITLNVYDDEIDIVTDFALGDKIIMLMKEHAPDMYNALDLNDELKYRLSEILVMNKSYDANTVEEEMITHLLEVFSVQSQAFHEAIEEYFYASIEEFSLIMHSFKTQDELNFVLTDHEKSAQLLASLEESYEKIVKQSNLEVSLSNDSNSSLFLESCFKLDIKVENLSEYFNISFSDSVVSTIQSTVQLLMSQDVSDIADAVIQDIPYTEFLGFISDVLPIYKLLEETEALMLMHAKDKYELDLKENPIQYITFDESGMFNYELAYEMFSFIGEEFLGVRVDVDRFDLFAQIFQEKPLILVDRLVEEFFNYFIDDQFAILDTTERLDYISEIYQNRILSDFDIAVQKIAMTPADQYHIERVEDALIMSSILYYDHYDLNYLEYKLLLGVNDTGGDSENGNVFKQFSGDHSASNAIDHFVDTEYLPASSMGEYRGRDAGDLYEDNGSGRFTLLAAEEKRANRYRVGAQVGLIQDTQIMSMLELLSMMSSDTSLILESKSIFIQELMRYSLINQGEFSLSEEMKLSKNDHAYRLVLFLLRENIPSVLPEEMLYKYLINLTDHYVIDSKEKIQYGLINKEGEYPIGKFIIGTNTISGEDTLLL